MPWREKTYRTNPEQSNAPGFTPPRRYRVPRYRAAVAAIPFEDPGTVTLAVASVVATVDARALSGAALASMIKLTETADTMDTMDCLRLSGARY